MKFITDVCDLISSTPLLGLKNIFEDSPARTLAKMECYNPTSIKDRAVRPEYAEKDIVSFLYYTGERYLSAPDLFTADNVETLPRSDLHISSEDHKPDYHVLKT